MRRKKRKTTKKRKKRRQGEILVGDNTSIINTAQLENKIIEIETTLRPLSLTEKGLVLQEVTNRHHTQIQKLKSQDLVNTFNFKDMMKGFMKQKEDDTV